MSSADTLSLSANIFAVIGTADVVFQNGRRVYELFHRYRAASSASRELLLELQALTAIIVQVNLFLDNVSKSAPERASSAPEIRALLTLCDQEFNILRNAAQDATSRPREGWISRVAKNLSWALNEQKVAQSCQRLQRLNIALTNALVITARQDDMVIRHELSATKAEIVALSQKMETIQLARGSLNGPAPPKKRGKRGIRRHFSVRERASTAFSEETQTRDLQSQVLDTSLHMDRACEMLHLLEYEPNMLYLANTVHEKVTMPLMLVKQALTLGFEQVLDSTLPLIAPEDLHNIEMIIDSLLLLCHDASVDAIKERYALRNTISTPETGTLRPWSGKLHQPLENIPINKSGTHSSYYFILYGTQRYTICTPIGLLEASVILVRFYKAGSIQTRMIGFDFSFSPISQFQIPKVRIVFASHKLAVTLTSLVPTPFFEGYTVAVRQDLPLSISIKCLCEPLWFLEKARVGRDIVLDCTLIKEQEMFLRMIKTEHYFLVNGEMRSFILLNGTIRKVLVLTEDWISALEFFFLRNKTKPLFDSLTATNPFSSLDLLF